MTGAKGLWLTIAIMLLVILMSQIQIAESADTTRILPEKPVHVFIPASSVQTLRGMVVSLRPTEDTESNNKKRQPRNHVMRQRQAMFHPHTLAIGVGDTVTFTNEDNFYHHVYSFSDTKSFSSEQFGAGHKHVVEFDRKGSVAVGCNIHDYMLAYIYVDDAPEMAVVGDDGMVKFYGLESQIYNLSVWYPGIDDATAKELTSRIILEAGKQDLTILVSLAGE